MSSTLGILQLMPATAKALATAPADPRADILAGRLPGTAREAFRRQRRARARRVQRGADGSREARPSSFARDAPLRQERRGSRSQARGLLVPHKRQERRALRLTAPKKTWRRVTRRDALRASPRGNSATCASALPQTLMPPFVAALHENAYSTSAGGLDLPIPRSVSPIR